jgi:hypothetical protein
MAEKYKLSGRQGAIWIVAPILGAPICFGLAFVYAYVNFYNPLIYFTALVWLGYLVAICAALIMSVHLSKCRNIGTAVALGSLIGAFALYVTWACFAHVYGDSSGVFEIMRDPNRLMDFITNLGETGWYQIFGFVPSGNLLWIFWLIEAAGIVLAGLVGGVAALHEKVYCEKCGKWAEDQDVDLRLSISDKSELVDAAVAGDVDKLLSLSPAATEESPHLRLNLKICPDCESTATLDFDSITYVTNDEGEVEEKSEDISPVFLLGHDQIKAFQGIDTAVEE